MDIDVRKPNRNVTEIDLNELQVGKRSWKAGLEDGFDGFFDHVGAVHGDVGP
jgi:hypothetical protein